MLQLKRIPVESSMLNAIAYDRKSQTLVVEFNTGAVWAYYEVPLDDFQALLQESESGSVGRYMHDFILGGFMEQKLRHGRDYRWS